MSILIIAITGADEQPNLERRAIEALSAAGIEVYRTWTEPSPLEEADAMRRALKSPEAAALRDAEWPEPKENTDA